VGAEAEAHGAAVARGCGCDGGGAGATRLRAARAAGRAGVAVARARELRRLDVRGGRGAAVRARAHGDGSGGESRRADEEQTVRENEGAAGPTRQTREKLFLCPNARLIRSIVVLGTGLDGQKGIWKNVYPATGSQINSGVIQ
jgi:hypothetical protein